MFKMKRKRDKLPQAGDRLAPSASLCFCLVMVPGNNTYKYQSNKLLINKIIDYAKNQAIYDACPAGGRSERSVGTGNPNI